MFFCKHKIFCYITNHPLKLCLKWYPSFFCVTVMGCHGILLSPKRKKKKKAQLVYYHLNGQRHVPGCSGQDPQDTQGKHCREWGVRGLYSCFNGLHAVYIGLIPEQYSSPSTIPLLLPPHCALSPPAPLPNIFLNTFHSIWLHHTL